jgi:hypothetical protein
VNFIALHWTTLLVRLQLHSNSTSKRVLWVHIFMLKVCKNASHKANACKVTGQEGSPGVTSRAPGNAKEWEGMNRHTPKWTHILGVGLAKDSWIFRGRLQGSKCVGLKMFLYHWKAIEM